MHSGRISPGVVLNLRNMVEYGEDAVVSRILVKSPTGNVTLFAFDEGQELSEHSTPYDALVQVVDGSGHFTIAGAEHAVGAGEAILLPANVPHAVKASSRFKMVLTMLR